MKRRDFLNFFFGGSLIATVAAFLYPVVRYMLPPKKAGAVQNKVTAAKIGELAPNTAKVFKFGAVPGVLINTSEGELIALAGICTHLTCTVRYESDTETLICPCHNGRFDLGGNVLAGPPPAPLETYVVEISGEDIIVSRKG